MNSQDPKFRAVIDLLEQLQQGVRRYVLGMGLAILVATLCLLFWVNLACDWGYYLVERADLPRGVRIVLFMGAVLILTGVGLKWILFRAWQTFTPRGLALVLERKFPQLETRLVTVVDLADAPETQSGLSGGMYEQTLSQLQGTLKEISWWDVFDRRPLMRSLTVALLLLGSVASFAWGAPQTFQLWVKRNVRLLDVPWPRHTSYKVLAVMEPNQRVVPFKQGIHLHPRGADLTLRVDVDEGSEIPAQMQIRHQSLPAGARQRAYLTRQGSQQFQYTLTGVIEDLEFRLWAGDAERRPFRVVVVDPPRLDHVFLDSLYPAYTRLNRRDEAGNLVRDRKPVQGMQVSLPVGTDFLLQAEANKPLRRVRMQTQVFDLEITPEQVTLTRFESQGGRVAGGVFQIPSGSQWLSADGKRFQIPASVEVPNHPRELIKNGRVNLPLPLPTDAPVRIFLEDQDEIVTAEPVRINLQGIEDHPPRVATQLRGIGTSVTRKAMIPIVGQVTDDYGVEQAMFELKIEPQTQAQERPLLTTPNGEREFTLQRLPAEKFERFELLPLELKIGQKFTLGIVARDGDTLTGPHRVQGEKYSFQIVSEEELLSQLHARELNLRQRFEQILSEIKLARQDLDGQREAQQNESSAKTKPADESEGSPLRSVIERTLLGIRKNHNESSAVEQSFREIREEMLNNVVQTTQSLERIDEKLLKPLHTLNTDDYNKIDQSLGGIRLLLDDQKSPLGALADVVAECDQLISRMESILKEMQRLESFGELVEMLKSIKQQQEDLRKMTDTERKRKAIRGLE
ncbi:MAG: hypothetical protein U0903_07590 [Planctomycetales bacterium]